MAKVELSVLFKKIQKDDKKEVLEFHVQGEELPSSQELVNMAGGMAHLSLQVDKQDIENFPAEYKNIQRDSKKTKLLFNIKGDTEDKVIKLYPYAGHNVTLFVEPSQMSVEEFEEMEEAHEGISYQVEKDGTVQVEGQVSMDDIPNENEDSEEPEEKEEAISDDELPDFDINDPDLLLD